MKLHELSATELSEKISNKEVSSEDITRAFLDRISSVDE